MNEINKQLFEDLHESQMNSIHNSIIDDARKVILNLLLYVQYDKHGADPEGKDQAITEGLKWIKNHGS